MKFNKVVTIVVHFLIGLMFTEAKTCRPPKIVGGEPAYVEEFPFIFAARYKSTKIHFCGGSIISEKYALTAAHCVHTKSPEDFYLQVGSSNLSDAGVVHTVRRRILHEDYNNTANDIAILEVDVMFQFNSKVQPIEIYPRVEVPVYSKVTVMGWGHTDPDVYMSSYVLMKIELKVWPLEECEKVYGKLPDKVICVGHESKKGGSCLADSGGPLIFKGKLIGIVSAGSKYCGEMFQPEGFYTRVAAFKDWIDSHTVRRRRRKGSRCRARSSFFRKIPKY